MEDEVDVVAAAWQRVRPELDVAPMQALSRLTRLARRLEAMRAEAFASGGLQGWEFDVLAVLRRAGAPHTLSTGRLTAETLVTSGTMTNRVDRLVARGLVTRAPDPGDRRGVLVSLTDEGRASVDGAMTDLLDRQRQLLADAGVEANQLAPALRALLRTVS
jgi:DNA-binding MarR family transcriptional regulator